MSSPLPSRFLLPTDPSLATRAARLGAFLSVGDPLADAAVEALNRGERMTIWATVERALNRERGNLHKSANGNRELQALIEAAAEVPAWVDERAADRGGEVVLRTGVVGGLVLGLKSLIYGYAAPGGNKPLVISGRLQAQATSRLNETARFVQATCDTGTLTPFGAGWRITLKVRLMHAQVRRLILAREGDAAWNAEAWGLPINQHDMAATALLFSWVFLEGVRQLGAHVTLEEEEDVFHMWRWSAHVMGVTPELQVEGAREAARLAALIESTQGEPDDDSRALTAALLHSGETNARPEVKKAPPEVGFTICRALIGDELAEKLAVPHSPYVRVVPLAKRAVQLAEAARRFAPGGEMYALEQGRRYWKRVVDFGYHDANADFDFTLPHSLALASSG